MKDYDDEYIAQTAPEDFVFDMRDELLTLRQWAQTAYTALQQGVQLMPIDLLGQWGGVRAVIESAPTYCNIICTECGKPSPGDLFYFTNASWGERQLCGSCVEKYM